MDIHLSKLQEMVKDGEAWRGKELDTTEQLMTRGLNTHSVQDFTAFSILYSPLQIYNFFTYFGGISRY